MEQQKIRSENRKTIPRSEANQMQEEAAERAGAIAVRNAESEKVKDDTDELLDEIDKMFESNKMVDALKYEQKGGSIAVEIGKPPFEVTIKWKDIAKAFGGFVVNLFHHLPETGYPADYPKHFIPFENAGESIPLNPYGEVVDGTQTNNP